MAYMPTQEDRKISNKQSTLHLKELEQEQQRSPKVSRMKEIIKLKVEINDIETKQTIKSINETKSWFFEKVNKIDKPFTRLIKKKRQDPNKIRNEKVEVTSNITEIQRIVREYYEQLHANTLDTWMKWINS